MRVLTEVYNKLFRTGNNKGGKRLCKRKIVAVALTIFAGYKAYPCARALYAFTQKAPSPYIPPRIQSIYPIQLPPFGTL